MWLYVLKNIHKLHDRPRKLQEKIFEKFFRTAEIAHFKQEEREAYEDSLKSYRDLKNSMDTSREEGKIERNLEVALNLMAMGFDDDKIAQATEISIDEIIKLRKKPGKK